MSGPTYVSHPALWEQFRHTHRGENFIPTIQRKRQKGGGILNRRRAYMIPVKRIAAPQTEIRQVTPVAAERERAQSDLKETIRNDEPHMPLQKSIKKIPKKKKCQSFFDRQREKTCSEEEKKFRKEKKL